MRAVCAAGGADVADPVTFVYASAKLHIQFRHVQIHRFEALTVVDGHGATENVEWLHDSYDSGGHGANRSSISCALVDSCVNFTSGLSVVQARNPKGGDDATRERRDERVVPIFNVGYGVAKGGESLPFFGGGMKRFDLRRENNILRRKDSLA